MYAHVQVSVCLFLFLASFPSTSLTSYKLLSLECTNTSIAFSLSHSPNSHHTHPIAQHDSTDWAFFRFMYMHTIHTMEWGFVCLCMEVSLYLSQLQLPIYAISAWESRATFIQMYIFFATTVFCCYLVFCFVFFGDVSAFYFLFALWMLPFHIHTQHRYGNIKDRKKIKVMCVLCVAFIEPPPSPTPPPPHYSSFAQKREWFLCLSLKYKKIAFSMVMILKHCLRIYSSHNLIFSRFTNGWIKFLI